MSQGCAHGHDHQHDHHHHKNNHSNHVHGVTERIGVAFFLNLTFAIIELAGGLLTNSVAVISDAIHDFGDSIALGLAWYLEKKSLRPNDEEYSYGYRRLSTLSAFFTSGLLVAGSAAVIVFAVPRIFNPEPVHTLGMVGLAVLGVIMNGVAALRISKGHSLNEKALMWHLMEDVLGWVLVLVSGIVIYFTGWLWLDGVLAVALALWILSRVLKNFGQSIQVFLQAAPLDLSVEKVQQACRAVSGVLSIHHPHLWSLDGEKHIFTAHILVAPSASLEQLAVIKKSIKHKLSELGIMEATLEFEAESEICVDPKHN
jgi:cobalt-zinc-cadmium efflux system protein